MNLPDFASKKQLLPVALISLLIVCASFIVMQRKPVFYIIGDSTVKNGDGTGKDGLVGWGSVIAPYFDTSKISLRNDAIGGRSSRTFITEGRWDKILSVLQPGDYVIMQFGHNDSGPLDDTARARGTLKGLGEESRDIFNPKTKQPETVHTYGWYMRKYVNDAKAKGATAIICSPVPRNIFKDGKSERADSSYGGWSRETAATTGANFIDLNAIIADRYDSMGQDKVNNFFPGDHTHTNEAGARLNAACVAEGLLKISSLKKYLSTTR
jgi:rhamnogalacturonan acetylesterase